MSSQVSRKNKDDQKREVMVRRPTFGNSRNIDFIETRIPLCDILDKGDRYSISLEVPGIQKDKIEVKATEEYITISGIDEKKNEEKEDNYVLNERTYRSFSRKIPFPENIVPSKVDATVENGILKIEVPKQKPTSIEETKIKIR
jgi:HSP20 family protein